MSDGSGKGCRMQKRSHTVQFRNLFDASPESYSLERARGTEDRTRRLETFVFDPTRGRAQCTRMYFLFLFLLCPPFLRDAIERQESFLASLAGSRRRVSSFFFFLAFKNKRIFGGEFEIRIRFIIGFVICDLKWMYNI